MASQITAERLLVELEEARSLALSLGQAGAAVAASMGRAKLCGLLVDRREDVTRRPTRDPDAPAEVAPAAQPRSRSSVCSQRSQGGRSIIRLRRDFTQPDLDPPCVDPPPVRYVGTAAGMEQKIAPRILSLGQCLRG